MDILNLNIKQHQNELVADNPDEIWIEILINDCLIVSGEEYPVNIKELYASISKEGSYNFWTCHCGIPGCAGVWVDIQVKHINDCVLWTGLDLPFETEQTYQFEMNAYASTISTCIMQLRSLIQTRQSQGEAFELYPNPELTGIKDLL